MFALLLLLLHHAIANNYPQETYIIKRIDSCPDIGYFFKSEASLNGIERVCYLCFCQDDHSAVCWQRHHSRCNANKYPRFGERKRDSRLRRSAGFSEIFFRDAAKDVFNKNTPEECKPFEDSYSEGCPPADWCIGCTVCDCDANGRWNCHVLSFCTDDKGKKKMKRKKGAVTKPRTRKKIPPPTIKPKPKTTMKIHTIKPPKQLKKRQARVIHRKQNNDLAKLSVSNKSKAIKVSPVKKSKQPLYKMKPQGKEKQKHKIIRQSKKSPEVEKGKSKVLNEHEEILKNFSNTFFKQLMASVEKMVIESQKNMTRVLEDQIMQKRSLPQRLKNERDTTKKPKKIKNMKKKSKIIDETVPKPRQSYRNLNNNKRNKRDISSTISSKSQNLQGGIITTDPNNTANEKIFMDQNLNTEVILETPMPKVFTKSNYFKYTVDVTVDKENFNQTLKKPETGRNSSSNITFYNKVVSVNNSCQNQLITHTHNFKDKSSTIAPEIEKNNLTKVFDDKNFSWKTNSTGPKNVSKTQFNHDPNLNNHKLCGPFCRFRNVFKKVISFETTNKTISTETEIKKFNIFKYLKHMIRNVFLKRNNKDKKFRIHKMHNTRKRNLIRTICKNFGSCNVDFQNKKLLSKIDQLRVESSKIMKSVRCIKGLLKLLDIEIESKKLNNNFTSIKYNKSLTNDIEKLNAILKDNYEIDYLGNLTETQNIQIAYIKQNTKIFMLSLEKFAQILNEIVLILTDCQLHYPKVISRYTRSSKNQATSKIAINKNSTIEEKLDKIKKLLINYNLVQNQFMKRMYNVIVTLRPNKTNNSTNDKESNVKVSTVSKNYNDTAVIETYTKNIITNLRKLKNLAQRLSFKNRRKREAMENDDILEYLLILMEYLLKQKKQLTITPANDGIDLLIEAIKSVPDIKVTRKKVLDYIPVTIETETTEAAVTGLNALVLEIKDTSNFVSPKFKTFESIDDDEENNDFYQYNKKFVKNKKNTSKVTSEEKKEDSNIKSYKAITTTSYPPTTISSYNGMQEDEKMSVVLGKIDMKKRDDDKGYEVFIENTDEDDGVIVTTTKSPKKLAEYVTKRHNEPFTTTAFVKSNDGYVTVKTFLDISTNKINRIKLDWIEESYNQEDERKGFPQLIETTTQKLAPTHTALEVVTRTARKKERKQNKYDAPVSSMSREITDEDDSRRSKSLKSDNVINKQGNLLNSLYYATDKTDMVADSTEDRTNLEQFPMYFV